MVNPSFIKQFHSQVCLFVLARWSKIQLAFPGRSCYTLQNRYRKLMQYQQINELFNSQSVEFFIFRL